MRGRRRVRTARMPHARGVRRRRELLYGLVRTAQGMQDWPVLRRRWGSEHVAFGETDQPDDLAFSELLCERCNRLRLRTAARAPRPEAWM